MTVLPQQLIRTSSSPHQCRERSHDLFRKVCNFSVAGPGICISCATLLEYSAHTHLTDDARKGSMNGCGYVGVCCLDACKCDVSRAAKKCAWSRWCRTTR